MEEIAVDLAAKAVESLVDQVVRACRYVICYDRYLRKLEDEAGNLDRTMQRVKHSVAEAKKDMKRIEADVQKWATDAESLAGKARDLLGRDGKAKNTCFFGCTLNPKAQHDLAEEAAEMVEAIRELIQKGQFKKVYYENDPPGLVGDALNVTSMASGGGNIITGSRASIFRGILKALDDEKHRVIGVYGRGGVGKTTLLKEVEKKLRKRGKPFHMIVKAKVSQTPDLNDIQYQIADALGLDLKDKQSQSGRKELLFLRLQTDLNEKILLILDDLWAELDLESIGIPLGNESTKCKLLLTSRDRRVLDQRMHAHQTFHLEGLSEDEAFRLFERKVGNKLQGDEELKAKAAQVVGKLAGLPLLIESIASTLRCNDVPTWDNMLIKIEDPNTERIVKWSYDHLESEDAKSLFLLCGLIGGTIQAELLFGVGMGLSFFEGFNKTVQGSRNRLDALLGSLRSVCLLQDGGDDNEDVTIHDLYSNAVVSTPFEGQNSLIINSNDGSWPKERLEKCWACLVNVGSDRLAQLIRRGFPDMIILMLSEQHDLGDFAYMEELRVLYLRSMHFTTLPSSIEILGNLHSLYLDYCHVEDVAILGRLKALQILSFASSSISSLPKEIGELTNLRSLNLSFCCDLEIITPGVLKSLINLEELLMQGSFDQWMGEDEVPSESYNAKLAELKSLTKLTALEISIPDPTILLKAGDLPFGNLIRFWIKVGNVADWREYEGLRTMMLKLGGCDSILSKEWVQKTLHKTQYLHLDGLGESKENAHALCGVHKLCTQGFPQLKHLRIDNSPSIEFIASSSSGVPLTAFTRLESLFLDHLINLEKICYGPVVPECFSKLKDVHVIKCHRLKYLWGLSQMQRLVHLEGIEVRNCKSMRAIGIDDAREEIVGDDIVKLPNLRVLNLVGLPRMASFCIRAGTTLEGAPIQVSFPCLESPEMKALFDLENVLYTQPPLESNNLNGNKESGTTTPNSQDDYSNSLFDGKVSLPSLEELWLHSMGSFKRIWHAELPKSSFCKLATLSLFNCSELLNVFPSTIIGRLHNLKKVEILSCISLEWLFDCGSLDSNMEQTRVLLPKLEEVDVKTANRLSHVVKSDSQIVWAFPSLKKVTVSGCSELRYLFPYFTAATLGKLEILEIMHCKHLKEVVPKEEGGRSKADVMSFPSLAHIAILGCRNFGAFNSSPTIMNKKLGETAEGNDESPQPLFNEMVKLPNITFLQIDGARCKELWNNQIPIDSFCKLEFLELKHCDNIQSIGPSHVWKRLRPHLEILRVESCRSVEIIYEGDGIDRESGKLRRLVLRDLENLRHIWQSDGLSNVPFLNLRFIEVQSCPRLRMLFPTFTPEFLRQIKELVVQSGEDMEIIAGHEKCEEAIGRAITFSELTALRLFGLPKFRSFLPEKYSAEFPSLQFLSRVSCGTEPDQGLGDREFYLERREFEIDEEVWKYQRI